MSAGDGARMSQADNGQAGANHTVTATVTDDSSGSPAPVVSATVTFTVIAGPHTGTTGTGLTNASGMASFIYTGTTAGLDAIEATFVDSFGRTQRSNRVTKEWVDTPPDSIAALEAKADRLEGKVDTLSSLIRDISGGGDGALNALEGKADRLEVKADKMSSMVSKIIDEGIDIGTIEVKTGKRFFLQTTLGGTLVNARLVKLLCFRSRTSPGTAIDLTSYVTQSSISTGVLDVSLSMPRTWHSPGYIKIFQFTVSYTEGAGQVHEGSQIAYLANDREED